MSERLLISSLPGETRAAWLRDGRLEDLVIQRGDKPSRLGDLYLGRIARVEPSLDAAFVELGLERHGFLPASEAPRGSLTEGQSVAVRVVREASGDKGLRLTARLTDPPADLDRLVRETEAPALLTRGDDPLLRAMTSRQPPDEILVDDSEFFQKARAHLVRCMPDLAKRLHLDRERGKLFAREGIDASIDGLLQPRVVLPSGGVLLFEPISSMTAVDVDSGSQAETGGIERQARILNLEAATEIPRQLRLRALSGLIVIDFLTLGARRSRDEVVAALKAGLKADREPTRVFPMAVSGLVEMTRRRGRPALHELLTQPLGVLGGGRGKDAVTLAFEALRALRDEAAHNPGSALSLRCSATVATALQGPAAAAHAYLEERLGRPITVQADRAERRPDYEIVLGSAS